MSDPVPQPIGQLDPVRDDTQHRGTAAQYRLPLVYSNSIGPFDKIVDVRHHQRPMILLDPGRFLDRLVRDLILILPPRSIAAKSGGDGIAGD
jgi:hypothetical protein